MTLPTDVVEAVAKADQYAGTYEHGFAVKNAWDTIRAHLLSQDAEIERLRNVMAPKLRELHYDANGLRATLDGGACKALAESFAEQFNSSGAVNYLDVEFTTTDGTGFIVTVRKRAKPTAHELRRLAESRLAAATAEIEQLQAGLAKHVNRVCELQSRLAVADALLSRCFVQIGELTKGLDPHDPIYVELQQLGLDWMQHSEADTADLSENAHDRA